MSTPLDDCPLDRFDAAWQRGDRPRIEEYLIADADRRSRELPRFVAIEFEFRLKAGDVVRIEDYLNRFPELAGRCDLIVKLLTMEFRIRPGRRPGRDELCDRFPQCRAELEAVLTEDRNSNPVRGVDPNAEWPLSDTVGRFRIIRRIDGGGMGVVYLAHDPLLGRHVALKVPRPSIDPYVERRFFREACSVAEIHHANICPVYEMGTTRVNAFGNEIEVPFLVTRFVDGPDLATAYPPPLPSRQAVALCRRLALALSEAHNRGVIHRDLKPSNVLVDPKLGPVITDFGLARRIGAEDSCLTALGDTLGSPAYMAPEQFGGDPATHGPASDVYSLGVILYELITGRRPFGSPTLLLRRLFGARDPPPPSQHVPTLDRRLDQICLQALAPMPEQRYVSMAAFAEALDNWLRATVSEPDTVVVEGPPIDPRSVAEADRVLKQWGWDEGLRRLRSVAHREANSELKANLGILVGWLAGERGDAEAIQLLQSVEGTPRLAGWALSGQALVCMRDKQFDRALELLYRADRATAPDDAILRGAVQHLRGALDHHCGRPGEALRHLCAALSDFGPGHYCTGRVLDTLGMVYAAQNNFPIAIEYFSTALVLKRKHGDDAGVALTYGQLGRLHLDWGRPADAEAYFKQGLEMCQRTGDLRGEAQMLNHLGQVMRVQSHLAASVSWLDEAVRRAAGRFTLVEGYARKDRAITLIVQGNFDEAEKDCAAADHIFSKVGFDEGICHIRCVRAHLNLARGKFLDAVDLFREAASQFEDLGELAESARACWDLARALRGQQADHCDALSRALQLARKSRRRDLAADIARELSEAGGTLAEQTSFLTMDDCGTGPEEIGSVLAVGLRLEDNAVSASNRMSVCHHLIHDFLPALTAEGVTIDQYRADGFIAVARGRDHAQRTVTAARAVARIIDVFNRPRRVLHWQPWQVNLGVATGMICQSNAGTLDQAMVITGGPAVDLAVALQVASQPGRPWLSGTTRNHLDQEYVGLRAVTLPGNAQPAWELTEVENARF